MLIRFFRVSQHSLQTSCSNLQLLCSSRVKKSNTRGRFRGNILCPVDLLGNRVPRSRGLGSGAARGPEDSGPLGAAAGAWPSRRGQGQGLAFASRRGRLAPPPPLPSGFPSRPPSAALSCAKISVLCGRRRTLLRARPPPDSSPGAARRPARRSRPAPAARSRPLGGPPSQPGNVRLVGRRPALPRFSFLPLARA